MNEPDNIKETITNTLAECLGAESEDIKEEDSLTEDLHMRPTDISDFVNLLEEKGVDTSNLDMPNAQTVSDIINQLE
jgi:acyl carrier protein